MRTYVSNGESLDGGFFTVRSRSGDPTTEDLHARTSQPKRFNNGKSFGLHGARRGGGDAPSLNVGAAAAAAAGALVAAPLGGTATHSVVRAGGVPVIAATAAAATTAESGCSGRVLSHGWAFLCADGGVLAWEQGMVSAERTGAAVGADQACVRFEHPVMFQELSAMEPQEAVPVEAADLVALTQPWESCGGKRELLLVSPTGLARYWPDLHSPRRYTDVDASSVAPRQSVTRVVALGPADFLCGLSKGGVLRVRPGLAKPCLLAQTTSVLGLGFSTIKRMGSFLGRGATATAAPAAEPPAAAATATAATATPVIALSVSRPPRGSPASVPARVVRLTTETLEVWSVVEGEGGGSGTECLEVRQPLAGHVQQALGVEKARLVDVAVVGALTNVSKHHGGGGGGGGGVSASSSPVANWGLELLVLAAAAETAGGSGGERDEEDLSVHAVTVSSEEASWVGSSVGVRLLSSHRVTTNTTTTTTNHNNHNNTLASPLPGRRRRHRHHRHRRATLVADNERHFFSWHGGGVGGGVGGSGNLAHVVCWPAAAAAAQVWSVSVKMGVGEERVDWEVQGSAEVSSRVALVGGCVGGGGALRGCPGVVLLSAKGQAMWVAPRSNEASAGGLPVDVELSPEAMSSDAAAEEWRLALIDEGLSAFEGGESMDTARMALESLLSRAAQAGSGAVSKDLDAAIVRAGREVLNGSWRHPSAFASPHQLVHLALTEKARRHRALVRFLMDAGAWGAASAGRAALAEGGEKIAAAARLCELQDAIKRKSVGAKAAALLDECISLSLEGGRGGGGGEAGPAAGAGSAAVASPPRDSYFEHTQGILGAFVELHTPRLDGYAEATPLTRGLLDPSLMRGDRLPLLDHLSVVVASVFEAALRHRVLERSVYRAGIRGKVWTASTEARRILFRQLLAYTEAIDGIALEGARRTPASEGTRGVIGRLSVLLLDGFKEEEEANPAASGRVEWQGEYIEAKALCVKVVAACGREDLARSLATKHGFVGGTVALCHEAELRKPGCENGHRLLRKRMAPPTPQGQEGENNSGDSSSETQEERAERESFALFVLDWHLKRGLKTALLDVGAAVPDILREFLADWREAELLWMFQLRLKDYTGAEQALTRGSPPANQKGGRCEAQYLWLSLAKLACLAGRGGGDADHARGAEIQRRLELAEVRERLVKRLPTEAALDKNHPWTWADALAEATQLLNSFSKAGGSSDEGYEVEEAADIAFQGYRALVVGMPESSHERADCLWREVVGLTLGDPLVGEAVAKGAMPSMAEDGTAATDREMEAVWKRPTVLHLLLRAIQKDRRLRRESPWAAGGAASVAGLEVEEAKMDLTDSSLSTMVREMMPAAADGKGATCEAWVAAIRKCPW